MTRRIIELDNFNSVGAGQKATLDMPVGPRAVHSVRVLYGTGTAGGPTRANMEAEIDRVRVRVDGRTQREFSAAELFAINAYHGVAVQDGELPIFFSEPWRRTIAGEDALAWRLGDINTFQLEIDINSGATAPTLAARQVFDDIPAEASAMLPIVKWRRFNIPVTATGRRDESGLPKSDAYYGIHAFSGNIDNVLVKTDQKEWWDLSEAQMQALLTDYGFVPQTNMYHIDFAHTARVSDVLPMAVGGRQVQDFQIDFTMGAASSFDIVTETIGPRD